VRRPHRVLRPIRPAVRRPEKQEAVFRSVPDKTCSSAGEGKWEPLFRLSQRDNQEPSRPEKWEPVFRMQRPIGPKLWSFCSALVAGFLPQRLRLALSLLG